MDTNCVPLHICNVWWTCVRYLSFYSIRQSPLLWILILTVFLFLSTCFFIRNEADLIQGVLKRDRKKLTRYFNFMFIYIDDVLSLKFTKFDDQFDHIYPIDLEIKYTTSTASLRILTYT